MLLKYEIIHIFFSIELQATDLPYISTPSTTISWNQHLNCKGKNTNACQNY